MRVLILDEQYREPPLDGGSRSLWDLQRSLAELGHEAVVTGDDSLLDQGPWDVVMASRPMLAARVAERARHAARSDTVYLGHDLHHRRLAATDGVLPGQPRPAAVMAALERRCWADYDLSVYPNRDEVAEVRAAGANARWFPYFRVDEVAAMARGRDPGSGEPAGSGRNPHGRDPGAGEPADSGRETPMPPGAPDASAPLTLLFVGGSTHAPNVTGLRWFAAEVLPSLPSAQVLVVGRWEPELRDPLTEAGLQFTGPLSDNELAALRVRADANIAPLTAGAGLKSKVIEALASGTPLIATSTAMAGIPSPWSIALPGDTTEQWRRALRLVGDQPEATAELSTRAAAYVGEAHGSAAYLAAVTALLNAELA